MIVPCEVPRGFPSGTIASKCKCGEIRVRTAGDHTDEWKGHFDYGPDEGGCTAQDAEDDE